MRVVRMLVAVLGLTLIQTASSAAAPMSEEALDTFRHLAIQHNGRLKPIDSFAREALTLITGSAQPEGRDPVEALASLISEPEVWQEKDVIAVPYGPLREPLGIELKAKHVSYDKLVTDKALMRMLPTIVQKQQRDEDLSIFENETMDMYNRFVTFSALVEHRLAFVPPAERRPSGSARSAGAGGAPAFGRRGVWSTVTEPVGYPEETQQEIRQAWSDWVLASRSGDPAAAGEAMSAFAQKMQTLNPSAYPAPWRLKLEVFYNRAVPFVAARLLYLLGAVWLLISLIRKGQSGFRAGMVFLTAGFIVHLLGILARVVLGGRPPVSNFYETMLWVPFIAVLIALIFERLYRVGYFGAAAGILGSLVLLLADYLPLDSSISPVVAVLRSNLWLTIHVLTIVASYGAIALAVVLAHMYTIVYMNKGRAKTLKNLELFVYRGIQVGVVLLAAGIILGGVWANASWGRYWGWDPKETWALITLLWFIAMLHGRFAGWMRGIRMALVTIAGFFLLLMTYYGVSFYLVGLHSYAGGHAKPLPPLLIGYLIAECTFLAVAGLATWRRQRA